MCERIQPKKTACSGQCQGQGGCRRKEPRCLVVAGCGGVIGLLEKEGGSFAAPQEEAVLFVEPQAFADYLRAGARQQQFDQLVLIGSGNDLAWMSAILPAELGTRVVAEMSYPLCAEWFHEPGLGQLKAALAPLIA